MADPSFATWNASGTVIAIHCAELIADRVRVTAERIQRSSFDPGRERGAVVLSQLTFLPDRPDARPSGREWTMPWVSWVWSTIRVTMPDPGGPVWDQTSSSMPSAFTPDRLPAAGNRRWW